MPYIDRDMDLELRYCAPKAKTRHFAIVQPDWSALAFDPAGNVKAAALMRTAGKKRYVPVEVTGQLDKRTIRVDSIAAR